MSSDWLHAAKCCQILVIRQRVNLTLKIALGGPITVLEKWSFPENKVHAFGFIFSIICLVGKGFV